MDNQKQYIQDCNDVVYKVMPSHYLKLSPWNDGEDRRVMEKDINGYKYISYKNACMIVNTQFANKTEKWKHNGKEYVATKINEDKSIDEYTALISMLPNHKAIIHDSKNIMRNIQDEMSLTISSEDNSSELKMIKHKGKIYYILLLNKPCSRVKAYNLFGEFVQWVGIKDCKPIFCETDKKYI